MPAIPQATALNMINAYRLQRPKSFFLNSDIITFIVQYSTALPPNPPITGIRAYLANDPITGIETVVLACTQLDPGGSGNQIDIPTGYFDYAQLCPPACNGDAGI